MQPPLSEFRRITGFDPHPMQTILWERVTGDDCAVLLKAPTGSGKTEAVLAPSLALGRRLFMIYPARSLVDDQIGRIETTFTRLSQGGRRCTLVVDTGGQSARRVFEGGKEVTHRQFNPRRHLYDGDVIVTTLDKFLYRFFGFGEQRKSFIFPFRIFHGLRRNLFVFDEAHSYEDTAFSNFVRLVKALYTAGLDVVLMTATMPDVYAQEFGFLATVDHLRGSTAHHKTLRYLPLEDGSTIADVVADQARSRRTDGGRLIATVETVEDAVKVWERLERPLLYHGRLDGVQRRKVYRELKRREEKGGGYLLVTTSAIEVGCDLNADCLITEICNPDSLVQRAGRCNRRNDRQDAEVVVVGNRVKHYLRDIGEEQETAFVAALEQKDGEAFDPADFLGFMQPGVVFDYRTEMLFDMLFEYVYEGRLENKPLHDKGLVVTRSWEPSVTLTTNREKMAHAVSVPLSRCAATSDNVDKTCRVYARSFHQHGSEYEVALRELDWGGCAYFQDLIIEAELKDSEQGWVEIPKPFARRRPDGYREQVVYHSQGSDRDRWLYYLRWRPEVDEQGGWAAADVGETSPDQQGQTETEEP